MSRSVQIEAEAEEIREEVLPVVREANQIAVASSEQFQSASDFLKAIKNAQKKVKDFFSPLKESTRSAWKAVCDKERSMLDPIEAAEKEIKSKLLSYQQEQERLRLEQERKLQAEAEARARKERERLSARAGKAEASGKEEKAEALREQAESVVAPIVSVQSEAPKVEGISIRKTWRARVVNAKAISREWLIVNEKALQAFARSTKGTVKVDGVEFFEEASMSAGSR